MFYNEIIYYMWIGYIVLILINIISYYINKYKLKRNPTYKREYNLDRLLEVNTKTIKTYRSVAATYLSTKYDEIEKFIVTKYRKDRLLQVYFNEPINYETIVIYEYNKNKKLINVTEYSNIVKDDLILEQTLYNKCEFVNIELTKEDVRLLPHKYFAFPLILHLITMIMTFVMGTHLIVKYIFGNINEYFLSHSLYYILVFGSIFGFFSILYITKYYIRRKRLTRSDDIE